MALPPGHWAASLRSLGASLDVLWRSTEVLAAATQLTRLAVLGGNFYWLASAPLWEWAGSHPSLQQLQIDVCMQANVTGAALQAICCLARERPALNVAVVLEEDGSTFDTEFAITV